MDSKDFERLRARIVGRDPDALTTEQLDTLHAEIRQRHGVQKNFISKLFAHMEAKVGWNGWVLFRIGISLAILAIFATVMMGYEAGSPDELAFMRRLSIWAMIASMAAFVMWQGPEGLRQTEALGVWLWGGVMLLIALNFGAVVIFASTCIELGSTTDGIFKVAGEVCETAERQAILKFFLAAKEFGPVLAVALGFASIAWVNFFNRL